MNYCNELLFDGNCIVKCNCEYGTGHSHHDLTVLEAIDKGIAVNVSDRPILENGVQYELEVSELATIEGLYFCDECNAFHVRGENIEEFVIRFN